MKILDKLNIKVDKKMFLFLFVLIIIGLSTGALFSILINDLDKKLIADHIMLFLKNIGDNKINCSFLLKNELLVSLIKIFSIWLLGISLVGLPIIIFLFFMFSFKIGFILGSILINLKTKGLVFSLIYIFPGQILYLLGYTIITMYAICFSIKLANAIIYKKTVNFKTIMNIYLKLLLLNIGMALLASLYNSFIMPRIIKFFISYII